MSDVYVENPEVPEVGDAEVEEGREGDAEVPEEGEGEEGADDGAGEEESASARLKRAEKTAHDKAGLAAKERSRRRAAERQNAELLSRIEKLEARGEPQGDDFAELVNALRDDDDEPITDINQIKKALKTFLARQAADQKAEGERSATLATIRNISSSMEAYEADFAEDHPDYYKAATFYRNARTSELEDMGYSGDRLKHKLATEFYGFTSECLQAGRDPAEAVYGLAKRRGFAAGKDAATAKLQKLQQASGVTTPRRNGSDNGLSWGDVAKLKGAARDKAFAALRARELGKG